MASYQSGMDQLLPAVTMPKCPLLYVCYPELAEAVEGAEKLRTLTTATAGTASWVWCLFLIFRQHKLQQSVTRIGTGCVSAQKLSLSWLIGTKVPIPQSLSPSQMSEGKQPIGNYPWNMPAPKLIPIIAWKSTSYPGPKMWAGVC